MGQDESVIFVSGMMKGEQRVDQATFNGLLNVYDALQYVTFFLFDQLHSLIVNYNLYNNI